MATTLSSDLLLQAIATLGPARLVEYLRVQHKVKFKKTRYHSMCEACEDLVTNVDAVDLLKKNGSELMKMMMEKLIKWNRNE